MDSVQRFGSTITSFLNPDLSFELSLVHETRTPAYPYTFIEEGYSQKTFKATEVSADFRYAIGEKRVNFSGGVFTTTEPSTLLEVKVAKGVGLSDSELDYLKIHSSATHRFNTKLLGATSLFIMGGYIQGNLPYPFLFNGRGTHQAVTFFYLQNTFQTMKIYEFVMDRYVSFFITQNFGNLLFKSKKRFSTPEFMLTNGVSWGRIMNQEKHNLMDVKAPEDGYFEGGVIINKILRFRYFNVLFVDIGVGGFYRYGPYAYTNQQDNLLLKIMIGASI
jgi:hypothetical protein